MFGPVKKENGMWRICTNQVLMELYREADIISEIRKGRLLWLRHVEIVPEDRTAKEVFKNIPEGKRASGKPRTRWLDDVKKVGVRSWRK